MSKKRQGKCTRCRVAYRWLYRQGCIGARIMSLSDAYCPKCGDKLVPTTHLLRWKWIENLNPVFWWER